MVAEQAIPHEGRVDPLRHLSKSEMDLRVRRRAHRTAGHVTTLTGKRAHAVV